MDFIVIDTEGNEKLKEIAVINSKGEIIFDAKDEDSIKDVLFELEDKYFHNYIVVFHNAVHDIRVLEDIYYDIVGKNLYIESFCTYEKAKELYPLLEGYTLSYLSNYFKLKVDGKSFNSDLAHNASYDALFTYHLYKELEFKKNEIEEESKNFKKENYRNPFETTKVDNPFQKHFNDGTLYKEHIEKLQNVVKEIKNDINNQSKARVILADAGNGKTHLMMRFLQEVNGKNRFFYIPKPNDKESILYHTYIKILQSLSKKTDSVYTQLEDFLAKIISNIYLKIGKNKKIIATLENPYNIYSPTIGNYGTSTRRENMKRIENAIIEWLQTEKHIDIVSINIFKALIKYITYKDNEKRENIFKYISGYALEEKDLETLDLKAWNDELNLEDFSLKAINFLGELSLFDEPLILSFDQLEAINHNKPLLERFGEEIKEILTTTKNTFVILNLFPDRWREYETFFDGSVIDLLSKDKIFLEKPSFDILKKMLQERAKNYGIELNKVFKDPSIYSDIMQRNSIRSVLIRAYEHFNSCVNGTPLPKTPPISLEEYVKRLEIRVAHLEQLNNIEIDDKPKIADTQEIEESKVKKDLKNDINRVYKQMENSYETATIITDEEDIGKLEFILEQLTDLYKISYKDFGIKKVFPQHRNINDKYIVGFSQKSGRTFTSQIKNFNEYVGIYNSHQFILLRDTRGEHIKAKGGTDGIKTLNNSKNGAFIYIDKEIKLIFDTLHQILTDRLNRDIEASLEEVMEDFEEMYNDFWLIKILKNEENIF